jgi:alkylation response protein AidB-like acyl-CoA dehydrogenase
MLAEVTAMQLYCFRLARLIQEGWLTDTIAALAKRNNARKAQVIADARDIPAGNGILLDYHVMRRAIPRSLTAANVSRCVVGWSGERHPAAAMADGRIKLSSRFR